MSPFNLEDYEPVEDRLRKFWKDHPEGRITTDLVEHADGQYVVKAYVWRAPGSDPDATGYAQERETDRGVNLTSALENCETSAIGRALANLGYAPKGSRPSREEMTKVSRRAAGTPAAAEAPKGYGEGPDGSTAAAGTSSSAGEEASSIPNSEGPSTPPASCLHLETRVRRKDGRIETRDGHPVHECAACGVEV